MSLDRVIKALVDLGISKSDAEVYVYIAKKGPLKRKDIAQKLRFNNKKLEDILKSLVGKQVIISTDNFLNEFAAIPFEETLKILIEINKKQTQNLNETKKKLIAKWKHIAKNSSEDN